MENFSQGEFARRLGLVEAAMATRGLDALVLTNITTLPWLCGDATGYMVNSGVSFGLGAAIVHRGSITLMVRLYEEDSAKWLAPDYLRVVAYSGDADEPTDPPAVLVRLLGEHGLGDSRVGFETDLPWLTPVDLQKVRAAFPAMAVEDVSDLVVQVSLVKSAEELAVMEHAAATTDAAVNAIFGLLAEGVPEHRLAAAALDAMLAAGSSYPIFQPFVTSGSRSALPHAVWSDRRIASGESLFVEISGSVLRYHAPEIRTGLVGHHPEAERVYGICEMAFEAAFAAVRPGALTGDVDRACRETIRRMDGPVFKLRTGYAVGLDWSARGSVGLMPGGTVELQPGMTFHVRPMLHVSGRFTVGCSETVLVTESGALRLGASPRRLHRV